MQNIFVDITSYLQLCSAKLTGYSIVIQVKPKLTDDSAVSTTG